MLMKTMKAAVFEGEGRLTVKEVPVPAITRDDEILIEVEACSICGTDVHITAVPPAYPATPNTILGHEFVGYVREKGAAVDQLQVGDRVVVNPNNYCGKCYYCRKNLPNQCEHMEALGIDYNGAFAKYCVVRDKVAYPIREDVDAAVAACAEPLSCVLNGLEKVHVRPGDSAVVIGAGPIGLMIAMLLNRMGVHKLLILETAEPRAKFAKRLSLGTVMNPLKENALEAVQAATGIGADIVFDVTGSQMATSVELVRKGGTVVLFGVNKKALKEIAQCEITTKEIEVKGTWLANATFPRAVQVLENREIDLSLLVTGIYSLEEIHKGLELLREGEAVKVIIRP